MIIKFDALSKPGGRKNNEDFTAAAVSNKCGCYLVADGLGGHRGGDIASRTACESIISAFQASPGSSVEHLSGYLQAAGLELEKKQQEYGFVDAIKTTLVILLIGRNGATWAHIGDSRLYYFKRCKLEFQTRDHSLTQKLVDLGEIAEEEMRNHEDRNQLFSVFDSADISCFSLLNKIVDIEKGDAFLLCSDGFWEYVLEVDMERLLFDHQQPERWLEEMEKILLQRVELGHDNYSALAVMVG